MKTKHLLTAICLPALFAACSAEEFADSTNSLNDRKAIEVNLSTTPMEWLGEPSTRMGAAADGININYSWTKDDILGAALIGDASDHFADDVVGLNALFEASAGSEGTVTDFTSKSPLMTGVYFFYHQYNQSTKREAMKMTINPEQVYVKADGTTYDQMAKYMTGISPLFDLSDEGIGYEKAMNISAKFAKLASPFTLKLTAKNAKEGTKIEKISIKKKSGEMLAGGTVQFNKLGNELAPGEEGFDIAEIAAATEALAAVINKQDLLSGPANVPAFTLRTNDTQDSKGLVIKNGEEVALSMAVPSFATSTAYMVTVDTSEGYFEFEITTDLLTGKAYSLPREIDFEKAKQRTTFEISSNEDFVNAETYINGHLASYAGVTIDMQLQDNVTIDALPSVTASYTSKTGTYELLINKNFSINDLKASIDFTGVKLGVAAGKTLTVDKAFATPLVNYGTMNITNAVTLPETVENYGTLNVNKATTFSKAVTNGKIANDPEPAYNATMNIAANATLTEALTVIVGSAVTINKDIELTLTAASTNGGTITNNGILTSATNAITNNGKIVMNGKNKAKITNSATAEIVIEKDGKGSGASDANSAITNNGTITVSDVEAFAALEVETLFNITDGNTGKTTATVTTIAEYGAATAGASKISNVILAGTIDWKIADSESEGIIVAPENDAAITLIKNLEVSGAVELTELLVTGKDVKLLNTTASNITITVAAVTVAKDAGLTVGAGLVFNVMGSGISGEEITINGKLTAVKAASPLAAAKMYFDNATINVGGSVILDIDNEFGAKTAFINNGSLSFKSADKVTVPTGSGSISGGIPTGADIDFS